LEPRVQHFSSNWKELRTLLWTMEKIYKSAKDWTGATVFYFTDNMTTYYVVMNGSSLSPELHKLVRAIKRLEMLMCYRIEVIHVPGLLMVGEGADGLSRGLWLSSHRLYRLSLTESALALGAVPFSLALLESWALVELVSLDADADYHLQMSLSPWSFDTIYGQTTIWVPTPEIARQALVTFLEVWVENARITRGLFLIPRIMQKDWGRLSRHIVEVATVYPTNLPDCCSYPTLIPFVLVYVPHFSRCLTPSRLDEPTSRGHYPKWHAGDQADYLRGL
jgi:hypothetical protein